MFDYLKKFGGIELNAVDRIDELKEKFMDPSFTKCSQRDPNKPKVN